MNQKTLKIVTVVALVLVVGIVAVSLGEPGAWIGNEEKTEKAPGFTLESVDGKTVSLSDYRGKVVVLDLMSTSCVTCAKMSPTWRKLRKDYGDGVEFIAIGPESKASLRKWKDSEETGMTYLSDPSSEVVLRKYQTHAFPGIVIIDQKGMIRYEFYGQMVSYNRLSTKIDKVLEEGGSDRTQT